MVKSEQFLTIFGASNEMINSSLRGDYIPLIPLSS
jgi:hypothetical protein